jgi:hypothetical protein
MWHVVAKETPLSHDPQATLRALWRRHWRAYWQWSAEWERRGHPMPSEAPVFHAMKPTFPEVCRDLTCGAKTRRGTPCKRRDLYTSGRCRLYGGLSTGPTTAEGKATVAQNGCRRSKPHER